MGKHKKKGNWKDKRQAAKKLNTNEEYSTTRLVLENKAFEAYYKVTLKNKHSIIPSASFKRRV